MSWLGQIRTHRRDVVWSTSLWQTLFAMTMGAQNPVITDNRLPDPGHRLWMQEVSAGYDVRPSLYLYRSFGCQKGSLLLPDERAGPVSLVVDLHIDHDHFGSSSDPSLNIHLHFPNDIDKSLKKMRLSLIKYGNITLTIITIHRTQSPLCLIFLVRLGGYIVNSLDCYSYRIIGKLTAFLHLQEFSHSDPHI